MASQPHYFADYAFGAEHYSVRVAKTPIVLLTYLVIDFCLFVLHLLYLKTLA